jgi:hypothetical protein
MDSFKDEINLLKSALEFKEEEKQNYSHYSWCFNLYFKLIFEIQIK